MSFYNKYRPQTFKDLHSAQVRTSMMSFLTKKKEELPHAFLLTGPRGIGKTTTARIIAKFFNCETPLKNGEPCGTCVMCTQISNGNAMDIMEMDAASNTGVDNIRDLKDKIMLAPTQAKWKVYIIDEVHMLSTGAFNALLKTLEEPPQHTTFILATTDPQKIPDTIKSRCLVLSFHRPEQSEVVAALSQIVKSEKLTAEDEALHLIATAADGSFRDATKLLEQASMLDTTVTKTLVLSMLAAPQSDQVSRFLQSLEKKQIALMIEQIESMKKEGLDIRSFYATVLKKLQQILVNSIVGIEKTTWNTAELQRCLLILVDGYGNLRGSALPDLSLELAVLAFCNQSTVSTEQFPPVASKQTTSPVITKPMNTPVQKSQETSIPKAEVTQKQEIATKVVAQTTTPVISGNLTLEKLVTHWTDLITELKPLNHSVSGVLRSTRPQSVENGIVTIVAFYPFHKDKLSESKAQEGIVSTIKKLFGEKVSIEIVLGKK